MDRNLYKRIFSKVNVSHSTVSTLIQKAIEQEDQVYDMKPKIVKRKMRQTMNRKMKRKIVALIAIVSILSSITVAAYTIGASNWFQKMFQKDNIKLDDRQKQTLDKIGNNLTLSNTSKDTSFVIKSIIGDSSRCYIYCEITAPENKVIDAFSNSQFKEVDLKIQNGGEGYSSGIGMMDIVNESSNKISFILEIMTSGDVNLIDNVISLKLKDLGNAEIDENGKKYFNVQAEGEWSFEIPIKYPDSKVDILTKTKANVKGYEGTITHVVLTPITLKVDYTFPYEEDSSSKFAFLFDDCTSSYLLTENDLKLHIINNDSLTSEGDDVLKKDCVFHVQYNLTKPINVEQIKAISIHGNEIPLK